MTAGESAWLGLGSLEIILLKLEKNDVKLVGRHRVVIQNLWQKPVTVSLTPALGVADGNTFADNIEYI